MSVDGRDVLQGQEAHGPLEGGELQPIADSSDLTKPNAIPRPQTAIRQYCLWCCNGVAMEVRLCPAVRCPLWLKRFGRKPTSDMLAEAGDCQMYPLEDPMTAAEFHKNGGLRLLQGGS